MYEELVKRLRNRRMCVQALGTLNDYPLLGEAADAIEKLSKQHEQQRQNLIALMNEKPRWISVEERLPEKPGSYLIYIHDPEVTPEYDCSYVSAAFYDKDEGLWKEEDDVVYCADLRCVNRGKVFHITHWMPLPEPPKEAEE